MERGCGEGGGRACGEVADAARSVRRRAALARILACAFGAAGALALPAPAFAQRQRAHTVDLPPAQDLAADAAASARDRVPIFLFFDRQDCPYCERALSRFVVPMASEEPWRGRAIWRQVEIDEPRPLVDFDGSRTTHALLAAWYGVSLTPTIIVVDGTGRTLSGPLVGLLTPDFYAAYLEAAIEEGARKLAAKAR